MKQQSFSSLERAHKKKQTKREIFLGKMDAVVPCRGPYCVLSFEAVAALRQRGITARRLEDGLPEWRAAGLPVEHA